jgi:glucose/arabinose dehydrogenase
MRKRTLVPLTVVVAFVASVGLAVATRGPNAQALTTGGFDFTRPETVASGLTAPWGVAFLPDGSALVTERDSARLLQLRAGQGVQVLGTIPGVVPGGEGGLLGLAVSPTYAQDQWVYAYYTAQSENRIVRFRLNALSTQQLVVGGLAKNTIHNGGRLAFGPDGMLYAGVGDAGNTANAQNTASMNGKILRMTPSGGVPSGNPFGTLVYSYGHRNVQGLAWDPQGRMFATEFGQNTFDEVNAIVAGGNYGWPTCEGVCNNPSFRDPIVTWATSESSSSGAAIANGFLFAAALAGKRLWGVPLTASGGAGTPVAELQNQFGRLRAVVLGPDGWLWVATSNRDGRGTPTAQDDRVLRFPPVGSSPSPSVSRSQPASPSPSVSRSASPSPSASQGGSPGCSVSYRVANQWPGNFQGEVTIVNTGTRATTNWSVTLVFGDGQVLSQSWNGRFTQTGSTVVITPESYNAAIPPNGSVMIGFLSTYVNVNNPPNSISCTRTP